MAKDGDVVVVGKNRQRGFWALVMIAAALPVSAWFVYMGFQPGRAGVGWSMVLIGAMGIVAFAGYGVMVLRTLRAPWRLELSPGGLLLCTPAYDLRVSWERVAGIAVAEVEGREGCVLLFDDSAAVAQGATFRAQSTPPGAVTSASRMQVRMEGNYGLWGYHLGIPGRILELGPAALAELLTRGRTGALWKEGVRTGREPAQGAAQ